MRRAILNVAVGSWYPAGQQRLSASLDAVGETAEHRFWHWWPGRSHEQCNYGFKVDAFDHALINGVDAAIWLDSSFWALKPLDAAWAQIEHDGVLLLWDSAWNCAQWCSDEALKILGWKSRDEAEMTPHLLSGMVGINFRSGVGIEFLNRWRKARDDGAFHGPATNADYEASADPRCLGHRHDQTAAAAIAWHMGLPLTPMEEFVVYGWTGGDPVLRVTGMTPPCG